MLRAIWPTSRPRPSARPCRAAGGLSLNGGLYPYRQAQRADRLKTLPLASEVLVVGRDAGVAENVGHGAGLSGFDRP